MTEIPKDQFEELARVRSEVRMQQIDSLPADIKALVHEYGWNLVKAYRDVGVLKARHIKHLIETTMNELSAVRGSYSKQGLRVDVRPAPKGS